MAHARVPHGFALRRSITESYVLAGEERKGTAYSLWQPYFLQEEV